MIIALAVGLMLLGALVRFLTFPPVSFISFPFFFVGAGLFFWAVFMLIGSFAREDSGRPSSSNTGGSEV
jgi:hypothetical protein